MQDVVVLCHIVGSRVVIIVLDKGGNHILDIFCSLPRQRHLTPRLPDTTEALVTVFVAPFSRSAAGQTCAWRCANPAASLFGARVHFAGH